MKIPSSLKLLQLAQAVLGLFELLVVALIGVPVYLIWEDRARRRAHAPEDLSELDLVGCVAYLVETNGETRVRVTDKAGVERVLPARIEDTDGDTRPDQELLIIEGPSGERSLLAVPAELPGLEEHPT